MTPYAVQTGDIPIHVLEIFQTMRRVAESIPDLDGEQLTCHAICEALASKFPVTRVEGQCGKSQQHSWLTHADAPGVVMDMYPVAGAVPFILFTDFSFLPWYKMYVPKTLDYDREEFSRQVEKIGRYIQ